jgi:hypothetical protein
LGLSLWSGVHAALSSVIPEWYLAEGTPGGKLDDRWW